MVSIVSLWLPVLLSAVAVFLLSFLVHMVLPLHKGDYRKLPSEDQVMDALRGFSIPPGDYMMPCPTGPADMKSAEFKAKHDRGPIAVMTVIQPGPMNMGPSLAKWFVYLLVCGIFAAYVAGRALGPGAPRLAVFRFAGVASYLAYGLALVQESVWYQRNWGTTIRYQVDALLYALASAALFAGLWPR